jgi:hypothetical protein
MITNYKNRKAVPIEISTMENDHLINSYHYFRKKRYEWEKKDKSGEEILRLSLLITALRVEIDRRHLFDF